MRRHLFGCAAAAVVAVTASLAAQERPQPTTPTQPRGSQTMTTTPATVEGCLLKEADVPGRKPNVAERAGVLEDYILTNAKVVKGKAPKAAEPPAGDRSTATSSDKKTVDRKSMFEVTGIDDEMLKKHVGKRVQVEGTFANLDQMRDKPDSDRPADDLAEIRATTIRQVDGDCAR